MGPGGTIPGPGRYGLSGNAGWPVVARGKERRWPGSAVARIGFTTWRKDCKQGNGREPEERAAEHTPTVSGVRTAGARAVPLRGLCHRDIRAGFHHMKPVPGVCPMIRMRGVGDRPRRSDRFVDQSHGPAGGKSRKAEQEKEKHRQATAQTRHERRRPYALQSTHHPLNRRSERHKQHYFPFNRHLCVTLPLLSSDQRIPQGRGGARGVLPFTPDAV